VSGDELVRYFVEVVADDLRLRADVQYVIIGIGDDIE
jgi:hypothetical protein